MNGGRHERLMPRRSALALSAGMVAVMFMLLPAPVAAEAGRSSGEERKLTNENRQIVEKFLDLINGHRRVREAFETYAREDYVQHNPLAGNGREAAIALVEQITATPGFKPSVKRIIAEGDWVVAHMHIDFGAHAPGMAVADIWRLQDGKLAEHWDVIQPIPAETASGNAMF